MLLETVSKDHYRTLLEMLSKDHNQILLETVGKDLYQTLLNCKKIKCLHLFNKIKGQKINLQARTKKGKSVPSLLGSVLKYACKNTYSTIFDHLIKKKHTEKTLFNKMTKHRVFLCTFDQLLIKMSLSLSL